jgi:hypothetical protein
LKLAFQAAGLPNAVVFKQIGGADEARYEPGKVEPTPAVRFLAIPGLTKTTDPQKSFNCSLCIRRVLFFSRQVIGQSFDVD